MLYFTEPINKYILSQIKESEREVWHTRGIFISLQGISNLNKHSKIPPERRVLTQP